MMPLRLKRLNVQRSKEVYGFLLTQSGERGSGQALSRAE